VIPIPLKSITKIQKRHFQSHPEKRLSLTTLPDFFHDSSTKKGVAMQITSNAFAPNGTIPAQYTCEGANVSPPLAWEGVPSRARSLALIVDDPDAPDPAAPRRIWVHWVLYNLPADCAGLAEAVGELPAGTLEGLNDWKTTGYGGPCPPIGRHRYFHKLYALDVVLPDLREPDKKTLVEAMQGHIVAEAQMIGTYRKGDR
jgi:Raf kinase inhibitor-like YbhB/YbcL family protein